MYCGLAERTFDLNSAALAERLCLCEGPNDVDRAHASKAATTLRVALKLPSTPYVATTLKNADRQYGLYGTVVLCYYIHYRSGYATTLLTILWQLELHFQNVFCSTDSTVLCLNILQAQSHIFSKCGTLSCSERSELQLNHDSREHYGLLIPRTTSPTEVKQRRWCKDPEGLRQVAVRFDLTYFANIRHRSISWGGYACTS